MFPKVRGTGFACSYKNVGFSFGAPEECWAIVELIGGSEIEKVILKHAGAEVGQGSHTVFCQMVSDAIGVPMEKVELIPSDTMSSANSGSVSASRMTFMAGNSIIGAANLALEKWKNEERPAIGKFQFVPPKTTAYNKIDGSCDPNFSYGYVAETITLEVDLETGQIGTTLACSPPDSMKCGQAEASPKLSMRSPRVPNSIITPKKTTSRGRGSEPPCQKRPDVTNPTDYPSGDGTRKEHVR